VESLGEVGRLCKWHTAETANKTARYDALLTAEDSDLETHVLRSLEHLMSMKTIERLCRILTRNCMVNEDGPPAPMCTPFDVVLPLIAPAGLPIISVDVPSSWDIKHGEVAELSMPFLLHPDVLVNSNGLTLIESTVPTVNGDERWAVVGQRIFVQGLTSDSVAPDSARR
jgi:hypothetical protein